MGRLCGVARAVFFWAGGGKRVVVWPLDLGGVRGVTGAAAATGWASHASQTLLAAPAAAATGGPPRGWGERGVGAAPAPAAEAAGHAAPRRAPRPPLPSPSRGVGGADNDRKNKKKR